MEQIVKDLAHELPTYTFKRGYFLLSTKATGKYWLDMYGLSHLFNASAKAKEYKAFLHDIIDKIIQHQVNNEQINSVIVPRWTGCTEDLFSETLLNICYELFRTKYIAQNINMYELFSAGGKADEYFLNPVEILNNAPHQNIKAIAFLALDIHSWLIDSLLANSSDGEVEIRSVISVLGRCKFYPRVRQRKNNPEKDSEFLLYPLFNASDYNPQSHTKGYSYLLDENISNKNSYPEKLYKHIFEVDKDSVKSKTFIPIMTNNLNH